MYKHILYIVVIAISALLLAGCSSAPNVVEIEKTVVRIDTLRIPVPSLQDSARANLVTDSLVAYWKLNSIKTDTVIKIEYYPNKQSFSYKINRDTILVLRIDTVKTSDVTITPAPTTQSVTFLDMLKYSALFIIVALCLYFLVRKL